MTDFKGCQGAQLLYFGIVLYLCYSNDMKILTADNTAYEMNDLPEYIEDLRFCVLDNSDPRDPDYFFIPLIFLETFNDPALVLRIGKHTVKMPYNWQIIIGEPDFGDLEVLPLTRLNDRSFNAFITNPLSNMKPNFGEIEILDVYQDVKWYFPKLKPGHILAIPLEDGPKPQCAFFVKDISKQSEVIDVGKVW